MSDTNDILRKLAAQAGGEAALSALERALSSADGRRAVSSLSASHEALLRAAAAKAGVSDITQKKDALRFTLAVFRPEALVAVCGLSKYKFRLTLSAGETPMLTLKLKPGEDTLEAALALVEDLKLASEPAGQA